MSRSFLIQQVDGLPVVTPPAVVDVSNAGEFRVALLSAAARGRQPVVVDMSQTALCDSMGLKALMRAHKRLTAERRVLRLVAREPGLLRFLAITGTDRVLPIFSTLGAALTGSHDGPPDRQLLSAR